LPSRYVGADTTAWPRSSDSRGQNPAGGKAAAVMNNGSKAVERLTALWALSEAGLGGFLHAVKTPFAGTIIGSVAVLIICLIADYSGRKPAAILKAVTIVLIVKLTVSPYAPLTACFALCFQAAAGAILFRAISHFRTAAFILGILSLVECAVQRIVFLTVLYGSSLWESINVFFGYLARQLGIAPVNSELSPSGWLIVLYILVYGVTGICVGLIGGSLPKAIAEAMKLAPPLESINAGGEGPKALRGKPRRPPSKRKTLRYGVWVLFIAATLSFLAPAMNGAARGVYVVLRTILVLLVWYFVVAPLLMKGLRRKLKHRESGYGHDIREVLDLFPRLKMHAQQLWARSGEKKGLAWARHFLIAMIVFALNVEGMSSPQTGRLFAGHQKLEKADASPVFNPTE